MAETLIWSHTDSRCWVFDRGFSNKGGAGKVISTLFFQISFIVRAWKKQEKQQPG